MGYIIVNRNGKLLLPRIYKTFKGALNATTRLGGMGLGGNVFYKKLA